MEGMIVGVNLHMPFQLHYQRDIFVLIFLFKLIL